MPRFSFNVRHRDGPSGLAADEEGDEFADLDAARRHALSMAERMIARDRLTLIRDGMACRSEITDAAGSTVLTVPFGDTVPPCRGLD